MRLKTAVVWGVLAAAGVPAAVCRAAENPVPLSVEADACEDRIRGDEKNNTEQRAVDKAGVAAVKLSGVIQKYDADLSAHALDVIAYRLVDEHLFDVSHEVTLADGDRVCVKLSGSLDVSADELAALAATYKDADDAEGIAEVAEKVKDETSFKPQTLGEKQLLYIKPMRFWNGVESTHYAELLNELFSHSTYFYVTEEAEMADYVVQPALLKSEVDEIDSQNHKMQMQLELQVTAENMADFEPLTEQQNHFILFSTAKDEQEVADTLIRKLLARAAGSVNDKINKYAQTHLENIKLRGKK